MIDYHIHPDYSIDADPYSMEEYCIKALELGLSEICFTTHCEFDPLRKNLDWFVRCCGTIVPMHPVTWLDRYFEDIARCSGKFLKEGLIVKAGLEAGFDHGLERDIEDVLSQYPFDFIIGSVHCLDHIAISSAAESPGYFRGKSLQEAADAYFGTLAGAIASGLFDVIGHLDIYRRHGTSIYGEGTAAVFQGHIDGILELMVKKGAGLEINTSASRHNQGLFYPAEQLLIKAVEKGVKNFTIGSDCHRISELGRNFYPALESAKKIGIKFSVYERRKPKPAGEI